MPLNTLDQGQRPALAMRLMTGLSAAGSSQATALPLAGQCFHEFVSVAAGSGALLPTPALPSTVAIFNAGANALSVYPPAGGSINGATIDAAYSLAAGSGVMLWAAGLSTWYSTASDGSAAFAAPSFTGFGVTGVSTPLEVGASIDAATYTFTWATSNSANVAASSIAITDATASMTLASGLANSGSDDIALDAIVNTSPATQVWTISGRDTNAGTFSRSFTVAWKWRVYAGSSASTTLTDTDIAALTDSDSLQSGFAGTYSIVAGSAAYYYLCYPDSLGSAANFTDGATGWPLSMATSADNAAYDHSANDWSYALVSVTNAQNVAVDYRVYRTQYAFTGTLLMVVS